MIHSALSPGKKGSSSKLYVPASLQKGDLISVCHLASPSSNPELERGREKLRQTFALVESDYESMEQSRDGLFAQSLKNRVIEFREALMNPQVKGIFFARGGYGSLEVLHELNDEISKHTKAFPWILGYSDLTGILNYIYKKKKVVTLHGPMIAGAAWYDMNLWEQENLHQILFSKNLSELNKAWTSCEWLVLPIEKQRPQEAKGPVLGGNLTVLASLVGTPYQIDFRDHFVFFEDVGEAPYRIDRMLLQMKLAGCFDGVRGMILGQFLRCDPHKEFCQDVSVENVFLNRFSSWNIPIVKNFPSGHGRPHLAWPVGGHIKLTLPRHVDQKTEVRGLWSWE